MSSFTFPRTVVTGLVVICSLHFCSITHARSLGLSWVSGSTRQIDPFEFRFNCDNGIGGAACIVPANLTAGVVPQMNWNNSDPAQITQPDRFSIGANTRVVDENGNLVLIDDFAAGAFYPVQQGIMSPMEGVLVDDAGVATGVQVAWTAKGTWRTPGEFDPDDPDAGDIYMHRSGLDDAGEDIDTLIEFSNVTSAFADGYDVYVYVGSDQDGRTGEVTLNSDPPIYYLTNTKDDEPGGHTQATATDAGSAFPSNYILYEGVTGDSFSILKRNVQGAGNLVHGIQIDGLPATLLTGDMDCDGDVDFDDIDDFVLGLNNPALYLSNIGLPPEAKGDTDGDGDLDFDDITGFVNILSGGGAQGVPEPSTITLLGLGLFLSLYAAARRRRRS